MRALDLGLFAMNWQDPVIDYCERHDHAFWSEPLNALTNFAFLVAAGAAYSLYRRTAKADHLALILVFITVAVGIGSFIFHTFATRGAALLDRIPIAVFIYAYFYFALSRFFGAGSATSAAITGLFAAFSFLVVRFSYGLNGSTVYLPPLTALVMFAAILWIQSKADQARSRAIAGGLGLAALLFLVSLVFRAVDRRMCSAFPSGTHFIWHLLNAWVLWLLLRTAILADVASETTNSARPQPERNAVDRSSTGPTLR